MKAYVTNEAKKQYWSEMTDFEKGENAMQTVRIYRDCKFQTIRGFGGAFTQSSGINVSKLPESKRKQFFRDFINSFRFKGRWEPFHTIHFQRDVC